MLLWALISRVFEATFAAAGENALVKGDCDSEHLEDGLFSCLLLIAEVLVMGNMFEAWFENLGGLGEYKDRVISYRMEMFARRYPESEFRNCGRGDAHARYTGRTKNANVRALCQKRARTLS